MSLSSVVNKSLRFLNIRSGATGNSAFAQLGALNALVDQINNMISYRMYDFMITQTGGIVTPALLKLASGATECPHGCDCKLYNCDCKCQDENAGGYTDMIIVTNTGPGVFSFKVNVPPIEAAKHDYPLKYVALVFSGLSVPGFVTVDPTSDPTTLIVTTRNITGVPENFIFNKTIVQARLYFTKF